MMRSRRSILCLLILLLIGFLSEPRAAALPVNAQAQPEPVDVAWIVPAGQISPTFERFYAALNEALAARGYTRITRGSDTPEGPYSVLVEVPSWLTGSPPGGQRLIIRPRPPRESLFSPAVEAAFITLQIATGSPQEAADLLSALHGYSQSACDLPLLDAQRVPEDSRYVVLEYVYARCLYQNRQYDAASEILAASQPVSDPLATLWQAAIAQNRAQGFQFDSALALDNRLIAALESRPGRLQSNETALLAERYLLRGQHRLYLYAWDAVLADYNAALALVPDHPRALYLRGLLHLTTNSRRAALDDFTRFLQLERSRLIPDEHPAIIAQAETYVTELTSLLATPQAH